MSKGTDKSKGFADFYDVQASPQEEIVEPRSFRNKLISVMAYTALIPLVMLAFLQQSNFRTAMAEADEAQLSVAANIARNIDSYIQSSVTMIRIVTPDIDGATVPKTLEKIFLLQDSLLSVQMLDDQGRSLTEAYKDEGLKAQLKDSVQFPKNLSKETQAHLRITPNGRVISFYASIGVPDGSPVRHVSGDISVRPVESMVLDNSANRDFDIVVFDSIGRVVTAIPASYVENGGTTSKALSAVPDEILTAGDRERILNSGNLQEVFTTGGTRNVAKIHAYHRLKWLGWTVVASQPIVKRDELLLAAIETSGLLLLLAVVLTVVVGFSMAAPLTRAINTLRDAVDDFAKMGKVPNVNAQLERDGTTEIVELGVRFERMAESVNRSRTLLRELNHELEEQVRQRTVDLQKRNHELWVLQRLLQPIEGSDNELPRLIELSVKEFGSVVGVRSLKFVGIGNWPVADAMSGSLRVDVQLGGTLYGWLCADYDGDCSAELVNSLKRLANSLAIVLSNERLVDQLSREHARLATVFDAMNDGVVIVGRSGCVRYTNHVARRLLGCGRDIDGQHLTSILAEGWCPVAGRFDDLLVKAGTTVRLESTGTDNARIVVDLLSFHVEDLPGFPGQRMGLIVRDMTVEAGIDQIKDNLVSVVAHELKTPLTALRLQVETIERDAVAGRVSDETVVHDMMDDALRLGQIIDDLLDVSRIDAGAMKLFCKVVHVSSLIDRATRLTSSRYPISVTRDIDPDAECFNVDPDRITQVFVNLFNNAARCKKPEQDKAICHVSVVADGDEIVIEVHDEGIGIAQHNLQHVFDRFWQGDMTSKRSRSGTGLGLSIVRGIVLAHRGNVSVRSELGRGTVFTVRLPV